METFVSGFAYGITTVVVGQPLDTIKTRMQTTTSKSTTYTTLRTILAEDGFRGLYRGGVPVLFGGGLMRSAQFGVYSSALRFIRDHRGTTAAEDLWLAGSVDPHVVIAGFAGGIGRGAVEGPVELMKIRRQVKHEWDWRELYKGSGATITRNAFLFAAFVIYLDAFKKAVDVGPFLQGALCSTLAWATIWPMDVAKSRLQSGEYEGKSFRLLLRDVFSSGKFFSGMGPGLTRSAFANGCSMVVYSRVLKFLEEKKREN